MSSFLISKFGENISKENLNSLLTIKNENTRNNIVYHFLNQKDKDVVLFLIHNNIIPKSMSLNLFKFIVNNELFNLFLELDYNKFNIHTGDDYALGLSSEYGHIEVVKFLIANGADINADDGYALRLSSENGHIEVVKFLIENGANIHAGDDYALRMSSFYGRIDVVKILINADLDYYINNEIAKKIVINHKLIEFYEKFNIVLN